MRKIFLKYGGLESIEGWYRLFSRKNPLVNLLGTQGWLTDRQNRPKNSLWNYFCSPLSSLAVMRCVAFWRTLPQVKFQSKDRVNDSLLTLVYTAFANTVDCAMPVSPPPAKCALKIFTQRQPRHFWDMQNHHHWENISKAQPSVVQSTTLAKAA